LWEDAPDWVRKWARTWSKQGLVRQEERFALPPEAA
jgi:hypothetical protein